MTELIDDRLVAAGLPPLPRPAWVEVDVGALANNIAVFREIVGPRVELSAVVKADGYGHGLKSTARAFQSAGADRLCVASLDEALALRDSGVTLPILVLFAVPLTMLRDAAVAGVDVSVSDAAWLREFAAAWHAADAGRELGVHLEVETGLSRGGFVADAVVDAMGVLREVPGARVQGIWTHIATPEEEAYTQMQVAAFDRAASLAQVAGFPPPRRHAAATGGLLTGRVPAYDGVRIGLGAYGLMPLELPVPPDLRPFVDRLQPAMALKCHAVRIETFPAGTRISYGGRWAADRDSVIATLPIGYADAIPRPAPWGEALVRARRVPLVGTVAMDAVMADVTDVPGIGLGDEFVVLGRQGGDEISAEGLARARNTIPWEVATGMSYRLPRVYHAGSVLMGTRTLTAETWRASAVAT
jgi:alanine racemase